MPYKDPEKQREAQRKSMAKARANKTARAWTAIVYPESAVEGWETILEGYHTPWAKSPLHDRDMNADGTQKKPHWHILLSFEGKKSYEQVAAITSAIGGTIPQICHNQKGMVRYFIHKDNPEKAQYKQSDIQAFGGFDVAEMLKPSATESLNLQMEMVDFCIKYDVVEFQDLLAYARSEREDWAIELGVHSFMLFQFIKSRRHAGRKPVNPVTGELYE